MWGEKGSFFGNSPPPTNIFPAKDATPRDSFTGIAKRYYMAALCVCSHLNWNGPEIRDVINSNVQSYFQKKDNRNVNHPPTVILKLQRNGNIGTISQATTIPCCSL